MTERREPKLMVSTEQFRAVKSGARKLPLIPPEQEIVQIAKEYRSVTREQIRPSTLAAETDVTPKAINSSIMNILAKGYDLDVKTTHEREMSPENKKRLKAIRDRVNLIEQVRDLDSKGLTEGQIQAKTHRDMTLIRGVLQRIRRDEKKMGVERKRKRRTPRQLAAIRKEVKRLHELGYGNREIAHITKTNYRYITNLKADMYGLGEIKRKNPKWGRQREI